MANNIQVTISEAKAILAKAVKAHLDRADKGLPLRNSPIFLHSSPGIGKSSITHQIQQEFSIGMVDNRLGSVEASDVNGIPYVSHAGQDIETMKFSIPDWFPKDPNSRGILFFDELSNAPISVQHAAYRIILDRELHNARLPDGWIIVAAGNLKNDKTGAKSIAPALANRFGTHLEIMPDVESFVQYAMQNELNHHIVGFLNFRNDLLLKMPNAGENAFPSPRSWEQVSYHLESGYTDEQLSAVLSGCVGAPAAADFESFRKYYGELPDFGKIASGKEEYTVPTNDLGLMFAVTSSLTQAYIERYAKDDEVKNLNKVLLQLKDDFLVLFYKSIQATRNEKIMMKLSKNTIKAFERVVPYI